MSDLANRTVESKCPKCKSRVQVQNERLTEYQCGSVDFGDATRHETIACQTIAQLRQQLAECEAHGKVYLDDCVETQKAMAKLQQQLAAVTEERDGLDTARRNLIWLCSKVPWRQIMLTSGCTERQIGEVAKVIGETE